MATPFNTLKLARRLESAGFPAQQAGGMSEAIAEAVSQLATKAHLALLKADLAALKAAVESKLALLERRIMIKLGGMMVVAVDIVLAGFKLIH